MRDQFVAAVRRHRHLADRQALADLEEPALAVSERSLRWRRPKTAAVSRQRLHDECRVDEDVAMIAIRPLGAVAGPPVTDIGRGKPKCSITSLSISTAMREQVASSGN